MEEYVFFKTKDPTAIRLMMSMVEQGRASVVRNEAGKQACRMSDDEIVKGIKMALEKFSVKTQWVAVYRILVDYYGFPSGYLDFYERIQKMMPDCRSKYACTYQAIQKGMLSSGVLMKPYTEWKAYIPKNDGKAFLRQLRMAECFLELLKALETS